MRGFFKVRNGFWLNLSKNHEATTIFPHFCLGSQRKESLSTKEINMITAGMGLLVSFRAVGQQIVQP